MNWLLVTVLIFWAGMAFIGYRKGFLRMLFSAGALIISFILTIILSPTVNNVICDNTEFDEFLTEKYASFIEGNLDTEQNADTYVADLLNSFVSDPEGFDLSDIVIAAQEETVAEKQTELTENIISKFSQALSLVTVKAVSFVLTWIIISLLLGILLGIIKIIEKIPVIKGINRVMGFMLGTVTALLITWAIFALMASMPATEMGIAFSECIKTNEFLKFINNTNIIPKLL